MYVLVLRFRLRSAIRKTKVNIGTGRRERDTAVLLIEIPDIFNRESGGISNWQVVPGGLEHDFELFSPEVRTLAS